MKQWFPSYSSSNLMHYDPSRTALIREAKKILLLFSLKRVARIKNTFFLSLNYKFCFGFCQSLRCSESMVLKFKF